MVSVRRTRRYNFLLLLWLSELNYLLLKTMVLSYSKDYLFSAWVGEYKDFYRSYFCLKFWKRFTVPVEVDKGPYTNNLILSSIYWVKYGLAKQLRGGINAVNLPVSQLSQNSLIFLDPVVYLLFAFQNKPLRSLIIYFITWVMYHYHPYSTTFSLPYGFILLTQDLDFFSLNDNDYSRVFYI